MDFDALIAHQVEYSDVYPVLNDLLEPAEARKTLSIMRKAKVWAYENEWRIVALGKPNTYRSFAPEAMAAVILGMRISEADKAYVLDLMDQRERRYGVRPVVYVATAAKQQYRIEIRRL
jgi:glycerol-3-phosphate dehydrogenase